MLKLADILPTGYEVGVLHGRIAPGDGVVIVGAGPVESAAVMAAKLFSPRTSWRSILPTPGWAQPSAF